VTEKQLEGMCREYAQASGGRLYKWASPGTAGVPDRILLMPGGRIAFVEFKRPDGRGRVSPLQARRLEELNRLGFKAVVINRYLSFMDLVEELKSEV